MDCKERLIYFDLLKGIGIICVLLGHTVLSGLPKDLIYGFHMPLFFFCSGIFFKNCSLKEVLTNNIRQLIVPYMFFFVALNASYFITNLHAGDSIQLAFRNVIEDLDILDEYSHCFLTIWFLPCLFFVRLLYALVQKLTDNKCLNLLMGGGIYIIGKSIDEIPIFLDTTLSVYMYYAIGHWFYKSKIYKQKALPVIPVLILLLYIVFIMVVHPVVDIKYNVFPWYLIFIAVPAIYALYQICLYLSAYSNFAIKFLENCGRKSITLLGLHRPLWLFVYPICLKLHLNIPLFVAVEMISALVIILPVHNLISKYAPILIGQKRK